MITSTRNIHSALAPSALSLSAVTLLVLAVAHADTPKWPASWSEPQQPFRIHGNTYYVGMHGLSSILITSEQGHVLIDGAMADSLPQIVANIRALGFKIEDVKLIVNSHVHFDHAGGIAELQRRSGASVAASKSSARTMRKGSVERDDPQYGNIPAIAAVDKVKVVRDGATLRVGLLALTMRATPGHTPGGSSWTWRSCEQNSCLNMVYADSLNSISAPDFLFTKNKYYPNAIKDFEKSFKVLSAMPCDVLLAPHPEFSDLFAKLQQREQSANAQPFTDTAACGKYVDAARERLNKRIAEENAR
ncbi:MAG: subclass B3 metallo-beta-lactamase [Candidatus Obscuribacterales bacterium]|nr:subclass B3 metallo-beta-lactamase [Steroidobacteraceae bacterium]